MRMLTSNAHTSRTRATVWLAVVAMALIAGVWVLRSFDPDATGSLFPRCLFLAMTGLYCPGCGVTRALHALAHLDLPRALAMNPLVVLALPVLGAMTVHAVLGRTARPEAPWRVLFDGRAWIAAFVLFGIARNLPWEPFASLAPGAML